MAANIAEAIVGKYQERGLAQSLSGEWPFFARHKGQNYYLCLATYEERRADADALVERIRGCTSEFPFLLEQLEHAATPA